MTALSVRARTHIRDTKCLQTQREIQTRGQVVPRRNSNVPHRRGPVSAVLAAQRAHRDRPAHRAQRARAPARLGGDGAHPWRPDRTAAVLAPGGTPRRTKKALEPGVPGPTADECWSAPRPEPPPAKPGQSGPEPKGQQCGHGSRPKSRDSLPRHHKAARGWAATG